MKTFAWLMILGGMALLTVSLFADYLGVGDVDPDHFVIGTKQIAGALVGGVVMVCGIVALKMRKSG